SYADAYGNLTEVFQILGDTKVGQVKRSMMSGSNLVEELYEFSYIASGFNSGLLSNVKLRRQTNGGGWVTVRQVDYAYYTGQEPTNELYGTLGSLKTAQVKDDVGNVLDTYYYRYYQSGEANGHLNGLKYVVNPRSYDRLTAAGNPLTASDAVVA